jgi:hypothetical protein
MTALAKMVVARVQNMRWRKLMTVKWEGEVLDVTNTMLEVMSEVITHALMTLEITPDEFAYGAAEEKVMDNLVSVALTSVFRESTAMYSSIADICGAGPGSVVEAAAQVRVELCRLEAEQSEVAIKVMYAAAVRAPASAPVPEAEAQAQAEAEVQVPEAEAEAEVQVPEASPTARVRETARERGSTTRASSTAAKLLSAAISGGVYSDDMDDVVRGIEAAPADAAADRFAKSAGGGPKRRTGCRAVHPLR